MNMKVFKINLLLLIVSIMASVVNAKNLATDAAFGALQVRQIPNTERELKSYFKILSSQDTVIAVINPVANCPRCESMVTSIIKSIHSYKKNIPTIIISVFADSVASKKYCNKYAMHADYNLYDVNDGYKKWLSFSTGYLHIPYLLKIALSSGNLIIGVEASLDTKEFIDDFLAMSMPLEKKVYSLDEENRLSPTTNCLLNIKSELKLLCPDSILLSKSDYRPEFYKDKLFFNDKLNECIEYFKLTSNSPSLLRYEKSIRTNDIQNKLFVDIPDSLYLQVSSIMRYMPLSPRMIDNDTLAVSYSLPKVWQTGADAIAYMNAACALLVNPDSTGQGRVITLNPDDDNSFFYAHFNVFRYGDEIAFECERETWPIDYDKEEYVNIPEMNPFCDDFYLYDQPIAGVFSRLDGSLKKRVGQLPALSKKTLTGSYFVNLVMDSWDDEIIYSDGFSGLLTVVNLNDESNHKEYKAFEVPYAELPEPRKDYFYSYDCIAPYSFLLSRTIEDVMMDDDAIYCVLRYGKHGKKNNSDIYSVIRIDKECGCNQEYLYPTIAGVHKYNFLHRRCDGKVEPYTLWKSNESKEWIVSLYDF